MQTLLGLSLVICLQNLFTNLAMTLHTHLKCIQKLCTKLVEILETNDNKIFQNVKTKWISMLNLNKNLKTKYKIFLMKMTSDNPTNQQANMNYEHLCNFQILLAFACILIFLEFIFILIKVAHMKDVFLCNLMVVIKVCKGDSYNMYCELCSNFITYPFLAWKSVFECKHENI